MTLMKRVHYTLMLAYKQNPDVQDIKNSQTEI